MTGLLKKSRDWDLYWPGKLGETGAEERCSVLKGLEDEMHGLGRQRESEQPAVQRAQIDQGERD